MKKVCSSCGVNKSDSEYYRRSDGRFRSMCKGCYSRYNKAQREKHLEARRAYDEARPSGWERHPENRERYAQDDDQRFRSYLKRTYDLSLEEFHAMHEAQDHRCAICRGFDELNTKLSVDHDHETGKVRGLLCFPCNTGIGKLGDSYERVQAAADYLKDNR